jgi:2-polyprenyl-6-methoxyphenol hydroxylase-like FAD-dependent oxidoreductase
VSRPELISLLRRRLPGGEARIHKNKRVISVERHDEGISVRCADGSLHHGSMVIGSDGVHSVLRDIVTKGVPAGAKTAKNSKTEMTATFGALFGSADRQPSSSGITDVPEGTFFETHGKDAMMQCAVMNGLVYFAIYGRLAEPTQERRRFSDADKMHFMSRWADSHFAPGVKVKDLVARAKWTNMVHLEEGVMDVPWYGDRVVLVGDSVHKMTPNLGLAYNQAIQGAVTLTNVLRRLLLESPAPSTEQLRDQVFAPYQARNMKNAIKANDISGMSLRMGSWCNPLATVLDKYLMPRINGDEAAIKLLVAPLILDGIVLDFVAEKAFKTGKKKWKNPGNTGK